VAHAVKGGNGEEEEDGDAAATLPHAVAPVGAPSVYFCGGAEKRKGCDGDAAATFLARGGARGSAKRGGGGTFTARGEFKADRAPARRSAGSVKIK
jgi:hypothetical protein